MLAKKYIFIFFLFLFLIVISFRKIKRRNDVLFYSYYEKNDLYRENFKYFLKNVVEKEDMDFYIIVNGDCSVSLPKKKNVKIIRRKNIGFDFGAYSHCITHHLHRQYDYYIFMNSSVRGPIPPNTDWRNKFKSLFKKDVRLVGVSINMLEREDLIRNGNVWAYDATQGKSMLTHVQSMFFILDRKGFLYLRDEKKFFSDEKELNQSTDIWEIIIKKEIGLSQAILDNKWNINCILSKYKDKDYRKLDRNINTSCYDPYSKGCYFGKDISPKEAIFHKISRMN